MDLLRVFGILVFFTKKITPQLLTKLTVGVSLILFALTLPAGVSAEGPTVDVQSTNSVQQAKATDRGRPQVINNTIMTDTGVPLRGENPRRDDSAARNDPSWWANLRDNYHLNTVRVLVYRPPQNYPGGCGNNCNLPTAQQIIPDLDEWVDRASEQGFYVIIDYHPVGGRDETDATEWWSVIAPRYKNRTHVIYEVTNEPGGAGGPLARYMERMRVRIRQDAPNTFLILWSVENAQDNSIDAVLQYTPTEINADWNKAAVGIHMYWGYNYSKVQQLKNTYPVLNTEIGGWNEQDYMSVTADVEQLGMSWIWLDGATEGRIPPSSVTWSRDPYFDGTTPLPTATPSPTPGATPSPTPTPPPTGGMPLPGHIEAEDYKSGGEGVGYHDTTAGNTGNTYRTDDVDIQTANDSQGGAYNIGWTAAGEWLAYDVDVSQDGYYDIIARVASGATGPKIMHVEVDGQNVTGSMTYSDASGWQSWSNLTAGSIFFTSGQHEMKVLFDTNGLNLNNLDVVPSVSSPTSLPHHIFLPLILR